jgi:hypothetical protein
MTNLIMINLVNIQAGKVRAELGTKIGTNLALRGPPPRPPTNYIHGHF